MSVSQYIDNRAGLVGVRVEEFARKACAGNQNAEFNSSHQDRRYTCSAQNFVGRARSLARSIELIMDTALFAFYLSLLLLSGCFADRSIGLAWPARACRSVGRSEVSAVPAGRPWDEDKGKNGAWWSHKEPENKLTIWAFHSRLDRGTDDSEEQKSRAASVN